MRNKPENLLVPPVDPKHSTTILVTLLKKYKISSSLVTGDEEEREPSGALRVDKILRGLTRTSVHFSYSAQIRRPRREGSGQCGKQLTSCNVQLDLTPQQ